jgi:hypothetical protein
LAGWHGSVLPSLPAHHRRFIEAKILQAQIPQEPAEILISLVAIGYDVSKP